MRGFKLGVVTIAVLIYAASFATALASQTYTIKIGLVHPPTHSHTIAFSKFKENAEKRSNGRFKVEIYPNAQLGGDREMLEMVAIGTLEITDTGLVSLYEPLLTVLEAPYLYRDRKHIKKMTQSSMFADLTEPLTKKNLRVVALVENGFRNVTNNKRPINSPADVKGLKIRVLESMAYVETFKALGAIPTPMPYSEVYSALQQGVVDGQENPFQNILGAKFFEVQKYMAVTEHIYNNLYVTATNKFWTGLPSDLRKIADDAMREACDWQMDYMASQDKELLNELKAKGMQITFPDKEAFRKTTLPAYDALYTRLGDRAKKIVETIRNM